MEDVLAEPGAGMLVGLAGDLYTGDLPAPLLRGNEQIAPVGANPTEPVGLYMPRLALEETWTALRAGQLLPYLSIIVPMGLLSAISSLQNLESAAAAGDRYAPEPSLVVNGIGTIGAALFGSPFPTSIYIGHPAMKAIGARAGYSTLK